ncbi:MAG: Tn3 family transposase [Pseudomonadota bacterium]
MQSTKAKKAARDQHHSRKLDHEIAFQELRKAQLTATEFANGVVQISQSTSSTIHERYYKIEALVDDYLAQIDDKRMDRLNELARGIEQDSKNSFYYDTLSALSVRLQRRVADVVCTVIFDADTSDRNLIRAIDHFRDSSGRIGVKPPSAFLTPEEHCAVYRGEGINTSLYKALLFIHMAKAIKSGRLNVSHSYRYRSIEDYLIAPSEWEASKASILEATDLTDFADIDNTLTALKKRLDQSYRKTNESFLSGANSHMSVSDTGKCRVRTPKTGFDTHSYISSTLSRQGIVPILQLLQRVDRACQFTKAFKHFSTKRSKMKPSRETLMAGVIAQGCNIGVNKLAKISTGVNLDTLRNGVNWYFDADNLRAANRAITSTIADLALANNYLTEPPALHTSSDGRKVSVAVDALQANYSFKYFGKDKGVTDYTFIDERQALFYNTVFSASDREAAYVIDGLLDNQVPEGHIHSTDTHGFTEQIFGVTHLMGVSFAPRLANLDSHRLYAFSSRRTCQKKGYALLPSRTINQKIILEQWDNVLRFLATIKTRRPTASQLFKRLSSYALDHPLYRALKEFGRIIKTQFILTYYDDVALRQRIERQLNRVELANKFSAAVFFDNDRAFQDGSLQQQEVAASCKLLIQNAIVLWNYLTLSEFVIESPDSEEQQRMIDAIRGGSVITWSHVNLRGEYIFTPPSANDDVFDIRRIKAFNIS